MENLNIILASKSPRRSELMELMGLKFDVIPSLKEEDNNQKLSLSKLSESLAFQKADDVFNLTSGNRAVVGSDTLVCIKGKVLGKPKSKEEAFNMLKLLSGNAHKVITSLCVIIEQDGNKKVYTTHDTSLVKFIKLSDQEIEEYLKLDEYKDKAGAYAIQGRSGMFIKKIKGTYATVMGLPTHKLYKILHEENIM